MVKEAAPAVQAPSAADPLGGLTSGLGGMAPDMGLGGIAQPQPQAPVVK